MDNTPDGANEDNRAPWHPDNNPGCEEKEIEVTVSVSLSKTVKITVPSDIELDSKILQDEVWEQIALPQDASCYINSDMEESQRDKVTRDLEGWLVDDFVVIPEP